MNTLEFLLYYVGTFFLVIILPAILTMDLGISGYIVFILIAFIILISPFLYYRIGHQRFEKYSKLLRLPIKTSPKFRIYGGIILTLFGSVLFMRIEKSNLARAYGDTSPIIFDTVTGFLFIISIVTLFIGLEIIISRVRVLGYVIGFLGFFGFAIIGFGFLGFTMMIMSTIISIYFAEREGKMSWGTPDG